MIRKLRRSAKSNNTLYLVIPRALAELLEFKADQDVDVSLKGGKIIITPIEETNEN